MPLEPDDTIVIPVSRAWLTRALMAAATAALVSGYGWITELHTLSKAKESHEKQLGEINQERSATRARVFAQEQQIRALLDEKNRTINVICECGGGTKVRGKP